MKKYLLLSLTILCLLFIYTNSLMVADISSSQSIFVAKLIQGGTGEYSSLFSFITEHIIRKIAHFCEYALLGFLVAITIKCWKESLKPYVFMILFIGLFVPVSDEFLQLFVSGRSGLVQDIVLDFVGFGAGAGLYIILSFICRNLKRR